MKTILIGQSGEEVVDKGRYFVVNVPDEFDLQSLDECNVSDLLDELANEQGIEWQEYDTVGVEPMSLWVEAKELDDDDLGSYPVITVTAEMLAHVEDEVE